MEKRDSDDARWWFRVVAVSAATAAAGGQCCEEHVHVAQYHGDLLWGVGWLRVRTSISSPIFSSSVITPETAVGIRTPFSGLDKDFGIKPCSDRWSSSISSKDNLEDGSKIQLKGLRGGEGQAFSSPLDFSFVYRCCLNPIIVFSSGHRAWHIKEFKGKWRGVCVSVSLCCGLLKHNPKMWHWDSLTQALFPAYNHLPREWKEHQHFLLAAKS